MERSRMEILQVADCMSQQVRFQQSMIVDNFIKTLRYLEESQRCVVYKTSGFLPAKPQQLLLLLFQALSSFEGQPVQFCIGLFSVPFEQFSVPARELRAGSSPQMILHTFSAVLCHFNYIITSFIIFPAMLTITIIISSSGRILLFLRLVLIMFFNHRGTHSNHAVTEYILCNWLQWAGCSCWMQRTYDGVSNKLLRDGATPDEQLFLLMQHVMRKSSK